MMATGASAALLVRLQASQAGFVTQARMPSDQYQPLGLGGLQRQRSAPSACGRGHSEESVSVRRHSSFSDVAATAAPVGLVTVALCAALRPTTRKAVASRRSKGRLIPRASAIVRAAGADRSPEQEALWQTFRDWLAARGGNMESVEIKMVDGLRGLVATRDIAEDETIVEIPLTASLDISDPSRSAKDPSWPALRLLELASEDSDELKPYFDLLPDASSSEMAGLPDYYTDAELQMLQCPLVVKKTQLRRELCEKRASEHSLDKDRVQWALCTSAQRAFSVMSPVDGLLRLLLPGIDLFNHDAHAQHRMKVRWDLEGYVTANFRVVAGSPIKKGEEVRICYGGSPFRPDGCGGDCAGDVALTNLQYLQRYGFVDECFGTTMVDGKWLVGKGDEATGVSEALSQTKQEEDEELLSDRSLSVAARTAVQFRLHLKRALLAQQQADAKAAETEAKKSDAQRKAEREAQEKEKQEADAKAANAAEAQRQIMKAFSGE
eukprot:TRINITY_DN48607_c0_g1_i2.p1 TRINITY_DN48607_c0_g1~~TRINITY_DN48607_c0_g1_i2.p1  ORF type:complete len:494 (+),score=123.55 TRINITY_DN48607_c0_g1_i2:124-1605(+)